MADNLKGIPFSSDDEGTDFVFRAKSIVHEVANREICALRFDEIYVVWFAFVRGNWKALISTSLPDGRIYEVSHKPDHDGSDGPAATVVDSYIKTHNIVVEG
jgi:Family of unknown function (DUF6275)